MSDFLTELYSLCSICGLAIAVDDGMIAYHSIVVDGNWLDTHPDDEVPTCEGSNVIAENIRPYSRWLE